MKRGGGIAETKQLAHGGPSMGIGKKKKKGWGEGSSGVPDTKK